MWVFPRKQPALGHRRVSYRIRTFNLKSDRILLLKLANIFVNIWEIQWNKPILSALLDNFSMNYISHHIFLVLIPHFLLVIKSSELFISWVALQVSLESSQIFNIYKINKINSQAINYITWHYRYTCKKVALKLLLINLSKTSNFLLPKAFVLPYLANL